MIEFVPRKGDIVRAETSAGIARAKGWVTRVITGEVLALTEKSVLVRGEADVYTDDGCMICGITLRKFESRSVHIGPVCAKNNNLHYPTDTELTDEQKQEIRDRIRATWSGEAWMPRQYTKFTIIEERRPATHTVAAPGLNQASGGSSFPENARSITGVHGDPMANGRRSLHATGVSPEIPVERIDVRFSVETLQTAKSQGLYIVCRSQYAHKDRCASVSPRTWDPQIAAFPPSFPRPGAWVYPVSPAIAHQLKDAFEGTVRRGTPSFTALLAQSKVMAEAGAIKDQDEATLPEIPVTKTKAWGHQRRAYAFVQKIWGE
jgi:hypothetical protein